MCVIMASRTHRPTEAEMRAGWEQNPWGAGVAWLERPKKGPAVVRWRKGIETVDEVIELVNKITPPLIVHFRIPTEGLEDKELTHPFPISPGAENLFEGESEGEILFHNGGWGNWRIFSLDTCVKGGHKLPEGMLNDSRMMAWNAYHYGKSLLQLINEKVIVFGPKTFEMFGTDKNNGWKYKQVTDEKNPGGIWYSNDFFEKHLPKPPIAYVPPERHMHGGQGSFGVSGGGHRQGTFRRQGGGQHSSGSPDVSGREHQQEQVEGSQTLLLDGPRDGGAKCALATDPTIVAAMRAIHTTPEGLANALKVVPNRTGMGFSPRVH